MLKFKLALVAAAIGVTGAFATVKHHNFAAHKWAFDSVAGTYTDITGEQKGRDYLCNDSEETCTAQYPEGQDPNVDPSNPSNVEIGTLVQ